MRRKQVDIGWAAGFFDGEGHCDLSTHRSGYKYPRLTVVSTDFDMLEKFAQIVGLARIYGPYQPSSRRSRKPIFRWQVVGAGATPIAKLLYPHLSKRRRAKFQEVFGWTS